jgi:release factor glutamine methyltransferase
MTSTAVEGQGDELKTMESRTLRGEILRGAQLLLAAGVGSARLDAEVLMADVLGMGKAELYLKIDDALEIGDERRFRERLRRRARREPVAYITGRKEFWSLDFVVTPDVLIPRPETELLVDVALGHLNDFAAKKPVRVLDLGTGSGAIAVCLAKERLDSDIWAVDVSPGALAIARINVRRHGVAGRVHLLQTDVFTATGLRSMSFDLIVSNPPYIRTGELPMLATEIHDWEPQIALDGGVDGMEYYRRIIRQAHSYLAREGVIALEIGADLAESVAELFIRSGRYGPVSVYPDYAGKARVIAAMLIADPSSKGAGRG